MSTTVPDATAPAPRPVNGPPTRDRTLSVRLTVTEAELVAAAARRVGLRPGTYLREALLWAITRDLSAAA